MPSYQTSAIILRRHNLGEADRIISFVTPERGVVRAVVKGARRIKSKLGGHVELFCETELHLAEGRNLDVVTSARLRHDAGPITSDWDRLQHAYVLAEMIDKLSGEGEPHPGLFELAQQVYIELSAKEIPVFELLELWYKLRLLDVLGYRPELGTEEPDARYKFYPDSGSLVPAAGAPSGSLSITTDQIKLWRLVLSQPFTVIKRITDGDIVARGSLPLIDAFYDHTFGRRFKSSEVLG